MDVGLVEGGLMEGGLMEGGLVEDGVLDAAGALEHPLTKITHPNAATTQCTNRLPGPITQMLDGRPWAEAPSRWAPDRSELSEVGRSRA